jgi:GT2 family glycosyltransferase
MLGTLQDLVVPPGVDWELLVVDNNSTDETPEVIGEFITELPVRYLFEEQQGLSHARNRGVTEARGEILLFTDDDVVVHPSWLEEMVTGFATHDCLASGGRVEAVWTQEKPDWYDNTGPYRLIGAVVEFDLGPDAGDATSPPIGANMAFRREVFTRHGLFRPDLGVSDKSRMLGEDTELSRRIMKDGGRVLYLPSAIIYHPVEPERVRKSYFERWYFNYGRTLVRVDPEATTAGITYFGVPRHLFRSLATSGLRWLVTADHRRRFYHKLQCCQYLGEIVEAYRQSWDAHTDSPVPTDSPAQESPSADEQGAPSADRRGRRRVRV